MGGSSKQPQVTQTAQNTMSGEQKAIFDLAFPYAQTAAAKPIAQFEGSGIAPLSAEQLQAQELAKQAATRGGALGTQAAATQGKLLDPEFMLNIEDNPYLKAANEATTRDVTRNLTEAILPKVRQGATMAGGAYSGGSSREGIAEGMAIGRTNTALSDAITRANYDQYNRGLSGLSSAVSANPSVQDQQLFEPLTVGAVGAQNQAVEQAQLDEKIRQFYTSQELPMLQAQQLFGLISGMPGGGTTSTSTGALPKPNKALGAAGGALSGAAAGSTFGPVGAGVGAGAGALLSLMMNR